MSTISIIQKYDRHPPNPTRRYTALRQAAGSFGERELSQGYVYVLSNAALPGLVKIGYSKYGGLHRARELSNTGLPHPFRSRFEIMANNAPALERHVHGILDCHREAANREFFRISVTDAIAVVVKTYFVRSGAEVSIKFQDEEAELPPAPVQNLKPASREFAEQTMRELRKLFD
jgi:T5orf172 domain-containing protein